MYKRNKLFVLFLVMVFLFQNLAITSLSQSDAEVALNPQISLTALTVTDNTVEIIWTSNQENIQAAAYDIYRNDRLIKSTNSFSYTDLELTPETNYTYLIKAIDADGNVIVESNILSVLTLKNQPNNEIVTNDTDYVTDRIIIKYKNDQGSEKLKNALKDKVIKNKDIKSKKDVKLDVISLNEKVKIKDLLEELKEKKLDSDIEYIQPDYQLNLSSNDLYFSSQWGLENKDNGDEDYVDVTDEDTTVIEQYLCDAGVTRAWENTTGSGIIVAVIDTGIDITHEDLADNIWLNTGEIPNNGLDDDGNGYIDDTNGWNFAEQNNIVFNSLNTEEDSHGTHVAGIIAAAKDNGKGIAGVAPAAKIMPLKVFKNGKAYTSEIISAIEYAESMNVRIINCSWGSTIENKVLKEAIQNSNILFICAAGNYSINIDKNPIYPASFNCPNIITVASVNQSGNLSGFSNYGENSVDVAAPGVEIISTLPGNSYGIKNGTSMAAAFVSGEAALLLNKNSNENILTIKDKIISSSDRLSSLIGNVYRAGKINCYYAVNGLVNENIIEIYSNNTIKSVAGSMNTGDYTLFSSNVGFEQTWDTQTYTTYNTSILSNANGILELKSTTNDPMIYMTNLGSFDPDTFRYMEIRYKIDASNPNTYFQIYFTNSTYTSVSTSVQAVVSRLLVKDGKWHTYYLDLWSNANYRTGGNITGWRYDWATTSDITIELDYIRLVTNPIAFEEQWNSQPYTAYSTDVISNTGGILTLKSTTIDPRIYMTNVGSFDPETFRYIEIRYKIDVNNPDTRFQIFFTNSTYPTVKTEAQSVLSGLLTKDGQWHTYYLDMWGNSNYRTGGNITGWRYDWATTSDVTMELDYIRLDSTDIISPVKASISNSGSQTTNNSFTVVADNVCLGTIRVLFPTWTSENGQDDLIWHEGVYLGNNKWKMILDAESHNMESGDYITHVYIVDEFGTRRFIGASTVNMNPQQSSLKNLVVSCSEAKAFDLVLAGDNTQNIKNKYFILKYNPNDLELLDACAETIQTDIPIAPFGYINDTDIMVNEYSKGYIKFTLNRTLASEKSWSGVINVIKFRSKINGQSTISYTVK